MFFSVIRTILCVTIFWLSLIICQFASLSFWLLKLVRWETVRARWMVFVAGRWTDLFLFLSGSSLEIHGKENIPLNHSYCIVSNHQGYFDIPVILRTIPWSVGFIAKKELEHIPFLASLMRASSVVFLDRKEKRTAMNVMLKASQRINNGQPMVVFPEGTRSQGPQMNQFRAGALKLATLARTTILPVTIQGTYQMIEDRSRWGINPARIVVQIHPSIEIENYSEQELHDLPKQLHSIISSAISPN